MFTAIKRRMILLATVMAAATPVYAVPLVDTTSGWFLPTAPFGEPAMATHGQTFTVTGAETQLNSFSFRFNDIPTRWSPDKVDFAAYVYAWDGAKAMGSQLYASGALTSTNNGGSGGLEVFTFNTGGTQLTAGQRYVAFLSASLFFDGTNGIGVAEWGVSSYTGGSFVFDNNGADFASLTTQTWDCADGCAGGALDTWFLADFSVPSVVGPSAIPEPGSLALAALALIALAVTRRRKIDIQLSLKRTLRSCPQAGARAGDEPLRALRQKHLNRKRGLVPLQSVTKQACLRHTVLD